MSLPNAIPAALCAFLFVPANADPVSIPPGLYELTAQTVLPHLEENLRYTTTTSRRCLGTEEATSLFPLLMLKAFAGCALEPVEPGTERAYKLACKNPETATGVATFNVEAHRLRAVLELKMGGKNMTLSQRITAPRLGACAAVN